MPSQIVLERGIHDVAHRPFMSFGECIGGFDQIGWEVHLQASAAQGPELIAVLLYTSIFIHSVLHSSDGVSYVPFAEP